jgi:CRISPR/Cas system-associated endonuclease Cas1
MIELLNVLYILTQGAMLHLDHGTVRIEIERETRLRVPLLRLSGIVVFGQVTLSPFLIERCAEDGRSLVWLDRNGSFKARVHGPVAGNVLLRRAQHLALSDPARPRLIARPIVAAKIQNSRQVLMRAAREIPVAHRQAAEIRHPRPSACVSARTPSDSQDGEGSRRIAQVLLMQEKVTGQRDAGADGLWRQVAAATLCRVAADHRIG